jgi:hypothetical protein
MTHPSLKVANNETRVASPEILELSFALMLPKSGANDFSPLLVNLASVFSESKELSPNHPAVHGRHGAEGPHSDCEIEHVQTDQPRE